MCIRDSTWDKNKNIPRNQAVANFRLNTGHNCLAEPVSYTHLDVYKRQQGEQLKSRVKKVCSGFHASFYPCPSSYPERQDMVKGVKARLEDLNMVSMCVTHVMCVCRSERYILKRNRNANIVIVLKKLFLLIIGSEPN